jgi:mono/diheme cytochrome c family protein
MRMDKALFKLRWHPGACDERKFRKSLMHLGSQLTGLRLTTGVLCVLLSTGAAALAGDAAKGKTTFVSICSSCHGLDGIATLDYAPSFAKCQRLDKDDVAPLVSVRDGIGGRMPPWGHVPYRSGDS